MSVQRFSFLYGGKMEDWEKKWSKMKPYLKAIHLELASASLKLAECHKLKEHLANRDEVIIRLEGVISMLKRLKADDGE